MVVLSQLAFELDEATQGLAIYCVGGAVRDCLLGLPPGDKDWVVVGASPEQMLARGFTPVGGDFPVFLHPHNKQEYALARTERKSGRGYQGFTFYTGKEVSLEQDLQRRDITINAMATDYQGCLIDPYGGLQDLQNKRLCHVGPAFMEDPVRILRLGRFLSRFSTFTVCEETRALCQLMVDNNEVDALVPERVWKEISRGLMNACPERMLSFLYGIGAAQRIMPDLHYDATIGMNLNYGVSLHFSLAQQYAVLCRETTEIERLSKGLRVSSEAMDYARLLPILREMVTPLWSLSISPLSPQEAHAILQTIERMDGIRKPERFLELIQVCTILPELCEDIDIQFIESRWQYWLERVLDVPAGEVARQHQGQPEKIKAAVHAARVAVLLG